MSGTLYASPVSKLLSYGACSGDRVENWPNYVSELGLTVEHVPELIRMTQDERLWRLFFEDPDFDHDSIVDQEDWDSDLALWAPIHAWRTLGQLQAAEAVKPLGSVVQKRDIDWCWEELPDVFGMIGAEALHPLDELLAEETENSEYNSKITLAAGVAKIAERFPDQRDRCVDVLVRHLRNYENQHMTLNGSLIADLCDLNAVEAAPVMEAAYTASKVDEMFTGSWPRVQVDLGLKEESDFTAEELAIHYTPEQEQMMANIRASLNQRKPSAFQLGLPIRRDAFADSVPSFREIATETNSTKPAQKSGFGSAVESSSKKGKKKKKKRK